MNPHTNGSPPCLVSGPGGVWERAHRRQTRRNGHPSMDGVQSGALVDPHASSSKGIASLPLLQGVAVGASGICDLCVFNLPGMFANAGRFLVCLPIHHR